MIIKKGTIARMQADAKITGNEAKVRIEMNALMSTWPGDRVQRDTLNTNSSLSTAGICTRRSKKSGKLWRLRVNKNCFEINYFIFTADTRGQEP